MGEDLDVDRIYLPKSELARFGLTFADIEAKRCDDRFKNFMLYFTNLAKEYYAAGWPVLNLWTGSFRLAGGFGFILYRTILDEVETGGFDIFTKGVKISRWKMFWLLATKWPDIY